MWVGAFSHPCSPIISTVSCVLRASWHTRSPKRAAPCDPPASHQAAALTTVVTNGSVMTATAERSAEEAAWEAASSAGGVRTYGCQMCDACVYVS
jgi:hypothetical protein